MANYQYQRTRAQARNAAQTANEAGPRRSARLHPPPGVVDLTSDDDHDMDAEEPPLSPVSLRRQRRAARRRTLNSMSAAHTMNYFHGDDGNNPTGEDDDHDMRCGDDDIIFISFQDRSRSPPTFIKMAAICLVLQAKNKNSFI